STFGPWALALESSPLPVGLLYFNASPVNNETVLCSWETASEVNNDFFTIERSKDGNAFEEISKVDGAGNSNVVLNYSYTDEHPYSGISYYRLKQIDFDGKFSYSQVVAVRINESDEELLVYPNPATDYILISFMAAGKEEYSLKISDAAGRTVISKTGEMIRNINFIELDVSELSRGIYFMEIMIDHKIEQSKIVLR
ncbi:MAG TPA: T9SS type A sorting domain-containing protein, partial [Bacteroidia bacterium]|nr:T9SS type A sorting domain-containing protein [Bacteroidia bacterium]